ncbi:MAG: SDR family NAD(P)-dependent oxidoreductase [Chthoniobacterales bacterium]
MNSETALITGSSSGIGLHLAHEFARHGHPLILVAPVQSELERVAQKITAEHGVNVIVIAKDLENENAAQEIFDELRRNATDVHILVNNAGHGYRGKSWEIPIEHDISMVRLNVEAVLRLTKLFLPPMLQRERGRILNTASVAGFEPGPLLNVYHSTKAFVLSWSEALAVELEKSGVTVTALCPGPTDTDFFPKADLLDTRAFQKASVSAPQDVAKAGYEGLMSGKLFVVPGGMNKALVAARRVLSEGAQAKVNQKFYEEVPREDQKRERGDFEKEAAQTGSER